MTAIITMGNTAAPVVARLRELLPDAVVYGRAGRVAECDEEFALASDLLPQLYRSGVTIVGVCSSGILIRCLGPILADKHREPPVLAVAADASSVVPLIGGHRGANALARRLAEGLQAHAALTTAGDATLGVALDEPLPGFRLATPAQYPNFIARLLAGETLRADSAIPPVAGDAQRELRHESGTLQVQVGTAPVEPELGVLHYAPTTMVLGVGCERGCNPQELQELALTTLQEANISPSAVAAVVSLDLKSDEAAVLQLAQYLEVPARFFDAATLSAQAPRLATPSSVVEAEVGVPGVSEGAALAAVGETGTLHTPKRKSVRATCAIAQAAAPITEVEFGTARGVLHILGTGPGQADWRLPAVDAALRECTDLVAYGYYLDLLGSAVKGKRVHQFALGEEELRAREALRLAAQGRVVGLVCSGDPGIYAMATLVFEMLERGGEAAWHRVEIVTTPGITALQSAAARIGAPIGHDFCTISLSNLLTPWEVIEQRLQAAAAGDFVIAFYNPVSKRRDWQLPKAREILLSKRPADTPVLIARQLGRPDECLTVTSLDALRAEDVDMFTVVLVGSSQSRVITRSNGGHWIYTPRGYHSKAGVSL